MEPGYDIQDVIVLHETKPGEANQGALLCKAPVWGDEEIWIPKSQITDDSEVYKSGTSGELIVTEWFARKQGWT